ncbi:hypothetical protein Q757_03625, partial [Oenococcus alcoholitolerans]
MSYDHSQIEKKWQDYWDEHKLLRPKAKILAKKVF